VLVFVCLCACFVSACLLSGVPGGDKAGFPTEAVDCLLFFTGVAAGYLFFLFLFVLFLLLFPCPLVRFGSIICCILYTKMNKWAVDGHQGELYIYKLPLAKQICSA